MDSFEVNCAHHDLFRQTRKMSSPVIPPAPEHRFASDNNATVHPVVMEALNRANAAHATAYGDDPWTAQARSAFSELFGQQVETFMVWNGTGANVLALATMLSPAGAVICSDSAHINVDETGAPERILGAKLIDLPAIGGKITPDQVRSQAHALGVVHHVQPSVLSITQSTEWGTLYSPTEIANLCDAAHSMGMTVHLDGARIANATAALGGNQEALRSFTVDAGVDVISFGGAKNGIMYGEAVIYLNRVLARSAPFVQKQVTQLPSKVRFISAQFSALLADDLWLKNATHANDMATQLYEQTCHLSGVVLDQPPVVNSIFPILSPEQIEPLREWSFFYDWDPHAHQVRWMTAWDTRPADLDRFVAGLRHFIH